MPLWEHSSCFFCSSSEKVCFFCPAIIIFVYAKSWTFKYIIMIITFQINYKAEWGQQICILGNCQDIVEWTENAPLVLNCHASENWTVTTQVPDFADVLHYVYAVRNTDGSFMYEGGRPRRIRLEADMKHVVLQDFWKDTDYEQAFFSTAFSKSLFVRRQPAEQARMVGNICFSLEMPQIEPRYGLAVIGNIPELGNWNTECLVPLSDAEFPEWKVALEIENPQHTIEYKYIVYELQTGKTVDFESGENRRIDSFPEKGLLVRSDIRFRRTRPRWKGAGVAVPVFSLRTRNSFGIGEFLDLKQLAEWAHKTGQKMIQTLPVNDTTLYHNNYDSYPYNSVSVFALNPIYLNIERMGRFRDGALQEQYAKTKESFNAKAIADYQVVADEKMKYFKILYHQDKDAVFGSAEYKDFFDKNKEWLVPYAVFCHLRDKFGSPNFHQWPQYSVYQSDEIYMLASPGSPVYDEVALHFYLQFHLHVQMTEAKDYTHALGVALKGDIPIGISPDSVEAWTHPELFNLNSQAGAPPDSFSISGQNWGFPTYNWDVMERDGYAWWRKRFQKMADYFDAYRIDHILGFFRIWEMSKDEVWGLTGRFSPALPYSSQDLWEMGIQLNENRLLKPYIRASYLPEIFGVDAEHVKERFLYTYDFDTYYFKPEFNTQKKVEAYFACNNLNDERSIRIRNGLYYLHCEVLFVRDLKCPELLHPRIALYQSYSYKALDEDTKQKLSCLHEDFFYHRHNDFWKASALRRLPALINATNMLVCGEDLGMVPACVPDVMHQLQILSLEIQRMPKEPNVEFAHPANAPYLSVCTTGTHDTNPLRAWWEENRIVTQHFYNNIMGYSGEAPMECTPEIASFIINQHIYSPAMWVILPLQDWLAIDADVRLPDAHAERINIPDNSHHFWCYRMHLNLEDLISNDGFNQKMLTLIKPRL